MTNFALKSFSVSMGGSAYGKGWDRIFGKKGERCEHGKLAPGESCGWCVGEAYGRPCGCKNNDDPDSDFRGCLCEGSCLECHK